MALLFKKAFSKVYLFRDLTYFNEILAKTDLP